MVFEDYEVPVAYSMVALATRPPAPPVHPLPSYLCYWTAFNNIYVTIADQSGYSPQLQKRSDGTICTRTVGGVDIPKVITVKERVQIDSAFQRFTDKLKDELIQDSSTRFFVYRTPRWHNQTIECDAKGRRLNGVLNVGHTLDAANPIWNPIDTQMFENYCGGARDAETRDALARQILYMLYTIRNNAVHGGKRADDAYANEVLEKALPLLKMIVGSFLRMD